MRRSGPAADAITREGYSHEVISVGFWPGSGAIAEPAFYAYAAPEPAGFKDATVGPAAAFYSADFNEFLLKYDDVRLANAPVKRCFSSCKPRTTLEPRSATGTVRNWNGRYRRLREGHSMTDATTCTHIRGIKTVKHAKQRSLRCLREDRRELDALAHVPDV